MNFTYKEANPERVRTPDVRAAIAAHAIEDGWFSRELLSKVDDETPIFLDSMGQIELPDWSKGRVVLIGDAAYCMSALSGQGTAMAMAGAGAYQLAAMLAQHPDHAVAFAAYESALRPHIEDTQRKARNVASSFVPSSKLKILLLTSMMKMLNVRWVAKVASGQFNVDSLFDSGILSDSAGENA